MEPGSGDNRMLVDLGLGTLFLVGMFLAAFTATGAVCSEMDNKTALTVVSKPVPRPVFILGKFLGVSGALLIANYILTLVLLLTIRHRVLQNASDPMDAPVILLGILALVVAFGFAGAANYLYQRVFTSTFTALLVVALTLAFGLVLLINKEWAFQSPLHDWQEDRGRMLQVAIGSGLITQGVLILTALAVALSARTGQVMTLMICVVVLVVGIGAGSISQIVNSVLGIPADAGYLQSLSTITASDESAVRKALFIAGKTLYVIAPNFQFHTPADAISLENSLVHNTQGEFSLSYVGMVTLYTTAYIAAILGLGITLFQKREVS